ncbi:hypothetical protein [Ruania halotolerans]|uniref:hypothetical protein n=1 Tax=Ruania halotolerans TaxID=2897773 RepID=UPI001E5EF56C|nr:hypothetical protein [Ruania halotolerans]UFU07866.1 hypothetical protein LQF10_07155 [Ruania halotolerans]
MTPTTFADVTGLPAGMERAGHHEEYRTGGVYVGGRGHEPARRTATAAGTFVPENGAIAALP